MSSVPVFKPAADSGTLFYLASQIGKPLFLARYLGQQLFSTSHRLVGIMIAHSALSAAAYAKYSSASAAPATRSFVSPNSCMVQCG